MSSQDKSPSAMTTADKIIADRMFNNMLSRIQSNVSAPLARFAPPRDLTLGGRGRLATNKKVFTPNLNVVRHKDVNVKTSKTVTSSPVRGAGRGRGRSDRGRRGGKNIIQTTGLFSEGAGAQHSRRPIASSSTPRYSDESHVQLRKPALIERKLDIKEEQEVLDQLLGDSEDDDLKDKGGFNLVPMKLGNIWQITKPEIKKQKLEVDAADSTSVKNGESDAIIAKKMQEVQVQEQEKKELPQPISLDWIEKPVESFDELFDKNKQKLFLVQLPHTLPCLEENYGGNKPNPPLDPSKEAPNPELVGTKPKEKNSTLSGMSEGQIGKIIRYKSGKVKLVLGETHFDMQLGTDPGFIQNIMSISTNREERSGSMINLGSIHGKVIVSPDWSSLIKENVSHGTA